MRTSTLRMFLALLVAAVVIGAASVAVWLLTKPAGATGAADAGGAGGGGAGGAPKIDPKEAERLTDLVAEPIDEEVDAASGIEAISLFAGILSFDKAETKGIGANIVNGIVHDAALTAFASFPGRASALLAPLAILEMTYQCSDLGGNRSMDDCASSSAFLALQVGMRWGGKASGAAKWFTDVFSAGYQAGKGVPVPVKPNPAALGRAFGQLVREYRWVRLLASVAKDAAAKQAAAALALRVTAASTRIAASVVPRSSGPILAAAGEKLVPQVARALAARIGAQAATVGARVGASIAGNLASKIVTFLGGPVGVALTVIQLTLGLVTAHLDETCVGDWASHCHATKETLDRLTGPQGWLRETFKQVMEQRFGAITENGERVRILDSARSVSEMQPRSMERERYALWIMAMRRTKYRDALSRETYKFTGHMTIPLWVAHLEGVGDPKMQFLEIYGAMQNLSKIAELALENMVEMALCAKESPAYRFDPTAAWPAPSCRATQGRCCARAKAVHAAMGVAHGAGSSSAKSAATGACAALKLAVYLQHDPGLVVDVFEELAPLAPIGPLAADTRAKAATWTAWRNNKGAGGMLAFLNKIPIAVDGTRRMYPEQLQRVACTIGIVDLLRGSAGVSSATEAVALFRKCIVEGAKLVYDETFDDADLKPYLDPTLFAAWPTHKDGDRAWMHNEPELMLLSVRWIPDKDGVRMSLDEACVADRPELEVGQCVPDFTQYADTHACRYIKSGKETNTADDPRTYEDDGDRKTHIVNWATGRCTPDTAYCEEFAMHPEPEDASVVCPTEEEATRILSEAAYFASLVPGVLIANPTALCNFPEQCKTKRDHCKGNVCTCGKPFAQKVLMALGAGETGAGALTLACKKVGLG